MSLLLDDGFDPLPWLAKAAAKRGGGDGAGGNGLGGAGGGGGGDAPGGFEVEEWACFCTTRNEASATRCKTCGTDRAPDFATVRRPATATEAAKALEAEIAALAKAEASAADLARFTATGVGGAGAAAAGASIGAVWEFDLSPPQHNGGPGPGRWMPLPGDATVAALEAAWAAEVAAAARDASVAAVWAGARSGLAPPLAVPRPPPVFLSPPALVAVNVGGTAFGHGGSHAFRVDVRTMSMQVRWRLARRSAFQSIDNVCYCLEACSFYCLRCSWPSLAFLNL